MGGVLASVAEQGLFQSWYLLVREIMRVLLHFLLLTLHLACIRRWKFVKSFGTF